MTLLLPGSRMGHFDQHICVKELVALVHPSLRSSLEFIEDGGEAWWIENGWEASRREGGDGG